MIEIPDSDMIQHLPVCGRDYVGHGSCSCYIVEIERLHRVIDSFQHKDWCERKGCKCFSCPCTCGKDTYELKTQPSRIGQLESPCETRSRRAKTNRAKRK